MNNRRAHQRFNLHLSAELLLGDNTITAVTRDLSVGGCCLESAYALPEGAILELSLFLVVDGLEDADTPPLVVGARVQWTAHNEEAEIDSRHLAGLRFEDVTAEQHQWLQSFLARQSGPQA
jgi:c-di-GMP-binding flagellar brake protein YcgR